MNLRRLFQVAALDLKHNATRPLFWIFVLILALTSWGLSTGHMRISSGDTRTFAYPCPPRSTNSRCGARFGLDSDRARLRSKLFAYSRHERTPCLSSMLKVQSGFAPSPLSARNSGRSGVSFGRLCS